MSETPNGYLSNGQPGDLASINRTNNEEQRYVNQEQQQFGQDAVAANDSQVYPHNGVPMGFQSSLDHMEQVGAACLSFQHPSELGPLSYASDHSSIYPPATEQASQFEPQPPPQAPTNGHYYQQVPAYQQQQQQSMDSSGSGGGWIGQADHNERQIQLQQTQMIDQHLPIDGPSSETSSGYELARDRGPTFYLAAPSYFVYSGESGQPMELTQANQSTS